MIYRNKKVLAHANGQACQFCGRDDGTTVAAHGNGARFGKGLGMKAHDIVAYLCWSCHAFVDCGNGSKASRDDVWQAAFLKSLPLYHHLLDEEGRRLAIEFSA